MFSKDQQLVSRDLTTIHMNYHNGVVHSRTIRRVKKICKRAAKLDALIENCFMEPFTTELNAGNPLLHQKLVALGSSVFFLPKTSVDICGECGNPDCQCEAEDE
jgi:hypothetical protein